MLVRLSRESIVFGVDSENLPAMADWTSLSSLVVFKAEGVDGADGQKNDIAVGEEPQTPGLLKALTVDNHNHPDFNILCFPGEQIVVESGARMRPFPEAGNEDAPCESLTKIREQLPHHVQTRAGSCDRSSDSRKV